MDSKKKDGLFRIAGIIGLVALLSGVYFAKRASSSSLPAPAPSIEHDHADPVQHGDVKGKKLDSEDKTSKASGTFGDDGRIVGFEAFKFGFSPDPLVVMAGEKVTLELKSRDVAHGMMIPEVDFNADIPVGEVTSGVFTAPAVPGKYPIFCSVFCGTDHGNMKGTLLVLPKTLKSE